MEHRPSTTPHHRTLFWAVLAIPDQLVPCCFSSASVFCLQLLQGRPLFLFPCRFQVKAWRVVLDAGFLRVCQIQPHFLCNICLATGSCSTRSHRSSFRIFFNNTKTCWNHQSIVQSQSSELQLIDFFKDYTDLRKSPAHSIRAKALNYS